MTRPQGQRSTRKPRLSGIRLMQVHRQAESTLHPCRKSQIGRPTSIDHQR
ncbi:hypothetical protein MGSAQ_000584 [marine sediment metagenome]|uniref:Uncharacterized protein n=1 Tax=marine sediment metagenome TaxID=412755 RepID=A0A1B6NX42_9ZZZZ